jgi:hypothetical protein
MPDEQKPEPLLGPLTTAQPPDDYKPDGEMSDDEMVKAGLRSVAPDPAEPKAEPQHPHGNKAVEVLRSLKEMLAKV